MRRPLFSGILMLMVLLWAGCNTSPEKSSATNGHESQPQYVVVQIHDPRVETVKAYPEVKITGSTKVRDVLLLTAKAHSDFSFTDTAYIGMGHLLTGINGLRNATGQGAYWQFCIDNVASDRGIDEKEVAPGQTLDWHYAEYGQLPCKKIGE